MESDFFEEYVKDVFSCMDDIHDKDGNVVDNVKLTDEQIKSIAERFSKNKFVGDYLCEIDNICIEYILEELKKQGLSY